MGRKTLFSLGLMTLPIRRALLIYWKDAGNAFLSSTQILDGLGGGIFNMVHWNGTFQFNYGFDCIVLWVWTDIE